MSPQDITNLIMNLGFPIVCCCVMGWFVYDSSNKHREDIAKLNEQHKQEMNNVTQAIENNTLALQKLTDKIDFTREEK